MAEKGLIIALAYPDNFVKATDGRYNAVLKRMGIVNQGLVCAGHAACLIIDEGTGLIRYSDFGRYITPAFKGRARTIITDPDVSINLKARFESGLLVNLKEIINYLIDRPHLTHGVGRLCVGLFYNADIGKAWQIARRFSLQGSMDYGPFTMKGTNCARYVLSMLNASLESRSLRAKLRSYYLLTPMPLDVVMMADKEDRYICENGELDWFSQRQWLIWKRLFERPKSKDLIYIERKSLYQGDGTWLENCGAGAWFKIEKERGSQLLVSRKDERGRVIFSHWFHKPYNFDSNKPYVFDFDTHAYSGNIVQNGVRMQLHRVLDGDLEKLNTWSEPTNQVSGQIQS
jgi:hypothetical protein